MIQNSSTRSDDDLKLCGCRQHSEYKFSDAAIAYREPGKSSETSTGSIAIEYPRLGITSAEHTLVFGSEDNVTLEDVGVEGKTPFFASQGYLTDFSGKKIPRSE